MREIIFPLTSLTPTDNFFGTNALDPALNEIERALESWQSSSSPGKTGIHETFAGYIMEKLVLIPKYNRK